MWTSIVWLLNTLLFIAVTSLALAGCCCGTKPGKGKTPVKTPNKKTPAKDANAKGKLWCPSLMPHRLGKTPTKGQGSITPSQTPDMKSLFDEGQKKDAAVVPVEPTKKAGTHDPAYQTLNNVNQQVFGEAKQTDGGGAGGGGGSAPDGQIQAPVEAQKRADTFDPAYQLRIQCHV